MSCERNNCLHGYILLIGVPILKVKEQFNPCAEVQAARKLFTQLPSCAAKIKSNGSNWRFDKRSILFLIDRYQ